MKRRERLGVTTPLVPLSSAARIPPRYGALVADLANQYNKGKDEYPTDITSAYSMIALTLVRPLTQWLVTETVTHPRPPVVFPPPREQRHDCCTAVARRNPSAPTASHHAGVTCYRCNNTGHYASDCPDEHGINGHRHHTRAAWFHAGAGHESGIDPSMGSCWTRSPPSPCFCNPDMLTNIRPSGRVLRAVYQRWLPRSPRL
jgi:hypothetical protein